MYVAKKFSPNLIKPGYFAKLQVKIHSSYVHELKSLTLWAYRYPCGRIKLVCYAGSHTLTGGAWGLNVVFDSVSSLYNIPGVHVYTSPYCLYLLLGMTPYGCK